MATAIDITRHRSIFAGEAAPKARREKDFDVDEAIQEIADSETEKQLHIPTWRDVINMIQPNRQGFDGQSMGQARIPQECVDSYPEDANDRGVGNIIGAMCPPGQTWSEVAPGKAVPEQRADALAKGTEKITDLVFEKLEDSLFETELHAAVNDLMVSTLFISIDPGSIDKPFRVRAASLDECFPVLNGDGEIENCYRRYKCRPSHILRSWKGARLSPRIQRLVDQKSKEKVTIVEATVFEPGRGFRFTVFDPTDKAILYGVEPDDPTAPSRWIVSRLNVRPGETYGYGPGVKALRTMRTLNKTQELGLKARAKLLAPPVLFDTRTGINPHTVRLGANYIGVYDGATLGGDPLFQQLPAGGNNEWSIADIERYERVLDNILFATQDIPPAEDFKGRTMYETQVRRQMVLQQRGVNLGRLRRELPDAVMRRCVYILSKLGMIPPIKIDGRIFQVRPLGPIAQAQRADEARGTLDFVSNLRAAVGDQAAALSVKIEDIGADVGKKWPGLNNSLLRDEQEREDMQKQAAQIAINEAAGAGPSLDPSNLPGLS